MVFFDRISYFFSFQGGAEETVGTRGFVFIPTKIAIHPTITNIFSWNIDSCSVFTREAIGAILFIGVVSWTCQYSIAKFRVFDVSYHFNCLVSSFYLELKLLQRVESHPGLLV